MFHRTNDDDDDDDDDDGHNLPMDTTDIMLEEWEEEDWRKEMV
ncbi:unnamed protein product [Spirodela intermedia]|uniref:Uncharacterized protein n=1 Tax=Spirodela intermedia TaxID=51605 RepID=A0A7I8I8B6_SPIIN|nr:unnamed protein product [Spirodela intermedia]CAA6653859.1 unnamed protein product [Spirodela intermedia]